MVRVLKLLEKVVSTKNSVSSTAARRRLVERVVSESVSVGRDGIVITVSVGVDRESVSKVIEERVLSRMQVELAKVESVIKEESIVRSVSVGEVDLGVEQ